MEGIAAIVASSGLMSDQCAKSLLVDLDVANVACIKLLISKLLSLLIIVGAFGLKVPQILALMKAESGQGMSFQMFLTETLIFSVSGTNGFRQGFPLTTFVENWVIFVQVVVICVLMCHYNRKPTALILYLVGTAALVAGLFVIPKMWLEYLVSASIGFAIYGRVPQIWSNFQRKDTGALSGASFGLSFGGGLARIFTTLQEAPSVVLLVGFSVGAALNGIILAQILTYGGGGRSQGTPQKKTKDEQSGKSKKD